MFSYGKRLRVFTWQEVRDKVQDVNPTLATLIDSLDPSQDFRLYLAKYPYGNKIVENGIFNLPYNDTFLSLDNDNLPEEVKSDFCYTNVGLPTTMILENTIEEVILNKHSYLPLSLFRPGAVIGLWKKLDVMPTFHPTRILTMISGIRSIFMLPPISDTFSHRKIRTLFGIKLGVPRSLQEQWELFKAIAHSSSITSNWNSELLLFSGKWIETLKKDPAWRHLYTYWLERLWKNSAFERNQLFHNYAFSYAQARRNLRPNPYLADTAQHLLNLAMGAYPGFSPAEDDRGAPVSEIQKVYINAYGLEYTPTLMQLNYFDIHNPLSFPVYYSLQFPTTVRFSPRSAKPFSTKNDLVEIKHITSTFIEEILNRNLPMNDTLVEKVASQITLDYFHNKPDSTEGIRPSSHIPLEDARFNKSLINASSKFSNTGAFVRGCIRIAHKVEE